MDLINRYIYAVTKSFGDRQREDIEKELRANIEDMIEEYEGSAAYEEKAKKALLELGDPEELADNYRGAKRYLIGPQYYERYMLVLKIIIGAVFGGISIAVFVESFYEANQNIVSITSNYFSTLFDAIFQAFAVTTIAFMIAERRKIKLYKDCSEKNKWDLSKLPVIPNKKAEIKLSKSITSIIFTTLFYTIVIALLYSAPELFAAFVHKGNETIVISIFNTKVLQGYKALIICVFILSISREMFKLYYRRWSIKLSVIHIILTVIATVFVLIIFTDNSIWNTNFPTEISKHMSLNCDFASLWEKIKNWIVAVIALSSLIECIVVLYKGIIYNVKR